MPLSIERKVVGVFVKMVCVCWGVCVGGGGGGGGGARVCIQCELNCVSMEITYAKSVHLY